MEVKLNKAPMKRAPFGMCGTAWKKIGRNRDGGAEGSRTPDLLIANETLYQLSYDPIRINSTIWRLPASIELKSPTIEQGYNAVTLQHWQADLLGSQAFEIDQSMDGLL